MDLAHVVLFGKISKSERLPPTSNTLKQHLKRCHYQTAVCAPGTHSGTGTSEPRGDRLDTTEDLLVSVFMKLDPIPQVCLDMTFVLMTSCATLCCKCRKSHVVCTGLCGCTT